MNSPWLVKFRKVITPRLRLFCFAYAGGGASAFSGWTNYLPKTVEHIAIQLPGRESRIRDPLITNLDVLVQEICCALEPYLDTPFLFFGHSLGSLISFEVARKLRENAALGANLQSLIVSGCAAPQLRVCDSSTHNLPDDRFIEKIRTLNGTPQEIFDNKEILDLVLPMLRADFSIADHYQYRSASPFAIPIHVFHGEEDDINQEKLQGWKEQTTSRFSLTTFSGDHFFIHSQRLAILEVLNREIDRVLTRY